MPLTVNVVNSIKIYTLLGGRRDPLDLVGAIPLVVSNAKDDLGTPPDPLRDNQLYSTFFIQPQMVVEMDPFHDRSTSFLLVPLVLRSSSPSIHPIINIGV